MSKNLKTKKNSKDISLIDSNKSSKKVLKKKSDNDIDINHNNIINKNFNEIKIDDKKDNDYIDDEIINDDNIDDVNNEENEEIDDDDDIDDDKEDNNDDDDKSEEIEEIEEIDDEIIEKKIDYTEKEEDNCIYEKAYDKEYDDIFETENDNKLEEIKGDDRITKNRLTIYEKVRILGIRSQQINIGAKPLIKYSGHLSSMEIAKLELEAGMTPLKIKRTLPNNKYEIWKINELILN